MNLSTVLYVAAVIVLVLALFGVAIANPLVLGLALVAGGLAAAGYRVG